MAKLLNLFLPGKEIIRLHVWILCMHVSTKQHVQSHITIQAHNDINNMVEHMHYNSCVISAAWKGKCIHTAAPFRYQKQHGDLPQKSGQLSKKLLAASSSHISCHKEEILNKRFMAALEVQTPCWITLLPAVSDLHYRILLGLDRWQDLLKIIRIYCMCYLFWCTFHRISQNSVWI